MDLEACSMSASARTYNRRRMSVPRVIRSDGHTNHNGCLSTELEDTRLEILGGHAGEDPPDRVASSELVERTRRKAPKRRLKVRTVIFLTAGWAIISEVLSPR